MALNATNKGFQMKSLPGYDGTAEAGQIKNQIHHRASAGQSFMHGLGVFADIAGQALKTLAGFAETTEAGNMMRGIQDRFMGGQQFAPALAVATVKVSGPKR